MEPPISRDAVEEMLLRAEDWVHNAGWDQDPFIAMLHWVQPGVLALSKNVGLPIIGAPGAWVKHLGERFLTDPELSQLYAMEDFFGWAFVFEAWMVEETPEEARRRWATDPKISNKPGRVEVRMLTAVDICARQYNIMRQRHQKPTIESPEKDPRTIGFAGRIHQGLTNMVLGTVRQVPAFADQLLDLETLFIPTIDESIASAETLSAYRKAQKDHPPE